jgi:hypothetical protein
VRGRNIQGDSGGICNTLRNDSMCDSKQKSLYIYRVIQEESAIFWEMIVCVILSKKVHINMCPIFDGYGVMGIF